MSYGVWNSVTKRFCFGISAPTRDEAQMEFYKKAPGDAKYRWRYEVKPIPKGWKNPKNPLWFLKLAAYSEHCIAVYKLPAPPKEETK